VNRMYDKHGWLVHRDVVTNQPCFQGDACFHMGLQAMLYCMIAEKSEGEGDREKAELCWARAWELWVKCEEYDFIRHPLFVGDKNSTSFDMMVIWDFVCSKYYPNTLAKGYEAYCKSEKYRFYLRVARTTKQKACLAKALVETKQTLREWYRPPFHYRKSKYWSGRHRAAWMFRPATVVAEGLYRLAVPPVMHKYYQGHLFMLRAATTYENTKSRAVLWFMRRLTKRIEKITETANPFFRWLARLPQGDKPLWINWGQESTEWMFQRDVRLKAHYKELYGDRIEFHKEETPNGAKLNMNGQLLLLLFRKSQI